MTVREALRGGFAGSRGVGGPGTALVHRRPYAARTRRIRIAQGTAAAPPQAAVGYKGSTIAGSAPCVPSGPARPDIGMSRPAPLPRRASRDVAKPP